ncbi:MAG: GNAT family N-acetyltransferase [Dehalococcoidia bacterium]|nr:GNAT family N-acetyltransferase [Dehalococcoidia bacterium]
MKLRIRPMRVKDKPAIMDILCDTPEFKPSEIIVAEEVIDAYLTDSSESGYHIVVAVEGESLVGYFCYGPTPLTEGTWDFYWAAVDSLARGRGVGSALFRYGEEAIRQARGRLILIETSSKPEYAKTRRFHRKQGFKLAGRIADFYEPGDHKLVYSKRLR